MSLVICNLVLISKEWFTTYANAGKTVYAILILIHNLCLGMKAINACYAFNKKFRI